jgi:hypothetical protein
VEKSAPIITATCSLQKLPIRLCNICLLCIVKEQAYFYLSVGVGIAAILELASWVNLMID